MDIFEKRYIKHKHKFIVGRKTALDLMLCANEILDIQRIELTTLPEWMLDKLMYNVSHHEDSKKFTPDQLDYQLYFVVSNEKSTEYYKDYLVWKDKKIYIFIEMNTGIFQTNCNYLGIDLNILRGISNADLEERNMAFKEYISFFELDDRES
ncbi:MAG: hypothetical protein K0Q48_2804 [Bacillota bacterium]|jgi:hypothetical protein|nr:hypothetical protein [Bacillota bacterium]